VQEETSKKENKYKRKLRKKAPNLYWAGRNISKRKNITKKCYKIYYFEKKWIVNFLKRIPKIIKSHFCII